MGLLNNMVRFETAVLVCSLFDIPVIVRMSSSVRALYARLIVYDSVGDDNESAKCKRFSFSGSLPSRRVRSVCQKLRELISAPSELRVILSIFFNPYVGSVTLPYIHPAAVAVTVSVYLSLPPGDNTAFADGIKPTSDVVPSER